MDAGYDAPRIARPLSGLPVEVLGRLRSDRVMRKRYLAVDLTAAGRPTAQAGRELTAMRPDSTSNGDASGRGCRSYVRKPWCPCLEWSGPTTTK